jgi:Zn-dependent peptidase ImmA (M78 family)
MEISYAKIKTIFPHFNEIALTDTEFWETAKSRRIIVREIPLFVEGYYEKRKGKHFIFINSDLRGVKWLHTAYHELCHFYLDVPPEVADIRLYRSKIQVRTKQEKIADALALMAILPFPDLEQLMHEDLSENRYLAALVRDRIAVLADYKR